MPDRLADRNALATVDGGLDLRGAAIPVYVPTLVAIVIITLHADSSAAPEAIVRPLLIAIGIVLLLQLAISAVTRNRHVGAYVASLFALGYLGLLPLIVALVVPVGWLLVLRFRGREMRLPWSRITSIGNVLAVSLLTVVTLSSASSGNLTPTSRGTGPTARATADAPDIYLILLDGYPRPDVLFNQFGIDVGPWLAEMASEEFDVSTHARSNYNMTLLTLASVLNYRHVLDLPQADPALPAIKQFHALTDALNEGRGIADLHRNGYEVVTIASPSDATTLYAADRVVETGQPTMFEHILLRRPLARFLLSPVERDLLADWHRAGLRDEFSALAAMSAERASTPRFVLAHIMAPHAPLLFTSEGQPQALIECYPESCEFFDTGIRYGKNEVAEKLQGHVSWVNDRVLDVVREIKSNSVRPTTIVVFSDHGFRHDQADRQETTSSLFLSLTPGHRGLFPDSTTPINILPKLLNAYVDADLFPASEETWWVDMSRLRARGILALEAVDRTE